MKRRDLQNVEISSFLLQIGGKYVKIKIGFLCPFVKTKKDSGGIA